MAQFLLITFDIRKNPIDWKLMDGVADKPLPLMVAAIAVLHEDINMNFKQLALAMVFCFGASGNAFAYVISGGTDVGGLDTYLGSTMGMGSGESTETSWASGIVGTTLSISGKTDPAAFLIAEGTDSIVAFQLYTAPGYFLVKDSRKHVLFKNEANVDWGVFDLLAYFGTNKLSELSLSHLTEFNGNPVKVTEPGTLALLGLGILGLVTARSKSKRNS
ncbi:PEP-CTERM sorting domain-containing protein [Marinobacter salsuginis]